MKTLLFSALLSLLALPAFARHGGIDSGGGNGTKSTPQEVSEAIDGEIKGREIGWDLQTLLLDIRNGLSDNPALPIRDARAAPILRELLQSKLLLVDDMHYVNDPKPHPRFWTNELLFEKKTDGPCLDQGRPRDGSASILNGYPHICISVPRLTRYTANELHPQIAALFLHELTHLLGHGEADAVYVQNYALKMATVDCYIEIGNDNAPNGRSMGYIFYVNIKPGSLMEVKYNRYFKPGLGETSGNDFTTTTVRLSQDNFHFDFTPGKPGKLTFQTMSYDGTYTPVTLEWDDTKEMPYVGKPIQALNLRGTLSVDGQALPLDGLYVRNCVR